MQNITSNSYAVLFQSFYVRETFRLKSQYYGRLSFQTSEVVSCNGLYIYVSVSATLRNTSAMTLVVSVLLHRLVLISTSIQIE